MILNDILEQFTDKDFNPNSFEYREEDIRDAILNEKPYIKLKEIFKPDFWPKIERWLNNELKNIKVDEEEINRPGGELKAKLEKYLEADTDRYDDNVETLGREIINVYNKWNQKEIKDMDLPGSRFKSTKKGE